MKKITPKISRYECEYNVEQIMLTDQVNDDLRTGIFGGGIQMF